MTTTKTTKALHVLQLIVWYGPVFREEEADSPLAKEWYRLVDRLRAICKEDDYATVPNDLLREIIAALSQNGNNWAIKHIRKIMDGEYIWGGGPG